MKNRYLIAVLSLIFYACSNTPTVPPADKKSKGADFLKEEKPKVDLTVINANAPVIKITLTAKGNTMADMLFDKDTIKVMAGSTIEFTFKNQSTDQAMQHNFVLVESGSIQAVAAAGLTAGAEKGFIPVMDEVLISSKLLSPGQKNTFRFASPAKGIYDFVCTYPGHYAKMKGVFVVE